MVWLDGQRLGKNRTGSLVTRKCGEVGTGMRACRVCGDAAPDALQSWLPCLCLPGPL